MQKVAYRKLPKWKYTTVGVHRYQTGIKGTFARTPLLTLYADGTLEVRDGYSWDGSSGGARDTKSSMVASLVHDALYQLMRRGLLNRKYRERADALYRGFCRGGGMSRFRSWLRWRAVVRLGFSSTMPKPKYDVIHMAP